MATPAKFENFDGVVYRALSLKYYATAFSPKGARLNGGRFNRHGLAAVYVSVDPETAYAEYQRLNPNPNPCVIVAAELKVDRLADITGKLGKWPACWRNWECDWEAARDDYLNGNAAANCDSWICGDETVKAKGSGILFPSRARKRGRNIVLYPEDAVAGLITLRPIDPGGEIIAAQGM